MTDLDIVSLVVLIAVTGAILIRGLLIKEGGVLQFSFLAAAVMVGWFLPQATKLLADTSLPAGGYSLAMFYAAAAMVALWLGNSIRFKFKNPIPYFSYDRLAWGALALTLVGALAFSLITSTEAEKTAEGATTGIVTIYFFLYKAQFMGYAISLLLYLKRPTRLTLLLVGFNIITLSSFVLFGGRRGPATELAVITACAFWFQRRILVPRSVFVAAIALGAVFVASAGSYRSLISNINDEAMLIGDPRLPTFEELMTIDWIGGITSPDTDVYEVKNSIYNISATWDTLDFRLGSMYYNHLVFAYVPGQLVGHELKTSLIIPQPDLAFDVYGHVRHFGTTLTGFTDTFANFGPFGVTIFFLIGAVMQAWWVRAMQGSIRYQFLYCSLAVTAMHAITHSTEWLLAGIIQNFLFTAAIFYFSALRAPARRRVAWR